MDDPEFRTWYSSPYILSFYSALDKKSLYFNCFRKKIDNEIFFFKFSFNKYKHENCIFGGVGKGSLTGELSGYISITSRKSFSVTTFKI